jgi:hypothetical protein
MKTCKTCVFWTQDSPYMRWFGKDDGNGWCCGEGYQAHLAEEDRKGGKRGLGGITLPVTHGDFGCVHHEEKESQ